MASLPDLARAGAAQALPTRTATTGESGTCAAQVDISSCYHCGVPVSSPPRWHAVVDGAARAFCCAGCEAVARTIDAAGLSAFYARRTEVAGRVEDAERGQADEWTRWDEVGAQAGVIAVTGDGKREVSLLLEGLQCGACIWLVESWLSRQRGVIEASVNFATRRARVVFEPGTKLSHVLRAIARIGYRAYPYDPARREALARRESRGLLLRMAVALLAMMQVMMFALPAYTSVDGVDAAQRMLLEWASLALTLPVILYSAAPFFRGAWRSVRVLRPGMDVPVAIGLAAAFFASVHSTLTGSGAVYYDSVTMFVALLLLARFMEAQARRRAGDVVETIARARPATALRLSAWPGRNDVDVVAASTLAANDAVLARAGDVVPADGIVIEGEAAVEEGLLTGEFAPRRRIAGDAVLAGTVVRDGALVIRVAAAGGATRLAAVERLVEQTAGDRPRVVSMADRFAANFAAALLALAAAMAIVWWWHDPGRVLAVTFSLLVVSCPCALSLATPAALAAATGALARRGIVIARQDALETLARATHVVFDKTGTLTTGRVALRTVLPVGDETRERALDLAAALEARSEHSYGAALREAAGDRKGSMAHEVRVVPGHGVAGICEGRPMRLGRPDWVAALSDTAELALPACAPAETILALGDTRGLLAFFVLGDTLRPDARELIAALRAQSITPMLLSGDAQVAVTATAASVGIADARGGVLPEGKRAVIADLQAHGAIVAMAGDGINDAPALAQAQVSVSFGTATPLAQWTADVVLLGDELTRFAEALAHARLTHRVIRQNLAWAFAYNMIAIPAAAFGFVTPQLAAVGMSLSSLLVVGNALRLTRLRGRRSPPTLAPERAKA